MTQSTDVVLAGDGYMVAPGTYRRMSDGVAEGTPGRIVLRDFVGGQRRAIQLEAERGWDSEGVGPVLFGQGVEPWPHGTSFADPVIGVPTVTTRTVAMLLGDAIYIGIGRFLYRSVALSASGWSAFAQVADLGPARSSPASPCTRTSWPSPAVQPAISRSTIPVPGTLATMQTGEKGQQIVGYANRLVWSGVGSAPASCG